MMVHPYISKYFNINNKPLIQYASAVQLNHKRIWAVMKIVITQMMNLLYETLCLPVHVFKRAYMLTPLNVLQVCGQAHVI